MPWSVVLWVAVFVGLMRLVPVADEALGAFAGYLLLIFNVALGDLARRPLVRHAVLARPARLPVLTGHDDVEHPRAVDALDAVELDVGSGRRAGDERDRAAVGGGVGELRDGVGHRGDDVARLDDADVMVGHERQRAPA